MAVAREKGVWPGPNRAVRRGPPVGLVGRRPPERHRVPGAGQL